MIVCLMPSFNSADVIKYSIDSVINGVEKVIIVDGVFTGRWSHYTGSKKVVNNYSTDDTESICKSYGSKVIFRKVTGPPGSKLNVVLSLVPSDCYILQMDVDEVMSDNGVENLKEFLASEEGQKYGNFAIMVYHLYKDYNHFIDMSEVLQHQEMKKEYCYFSRVHYYRKGFVFDSTSSELMFVNGAMNKFYKPATKNYAYGYSYCIPESVCKLVDLRFLRKNVYQQNRIHNTQKVQNKEYVTVQYGTYIKKFQVKKFGLNREFSSLK